MPKYDTLRDFYYNIPSSSGNNDAASGADLKRALDGLGAEEKCRLLLKPLSPADKENSLTYIVSGHIRGISEDEQWKTDFLEVALDEIQQLTQRADERVALLTSTNELGQTVFHKALNAFGDNLALFDVLTKKLYEWGGDEVANNWMKSFLNQPFGEIDKKVSNTLQDVRGDFPPGTEKYSLISSLCNDGYKPAPYETLKATVDKARPLVLAWLDQNPVDPRNDYKVEKYQKLREFAEDPDFVSSDKTPLSQVFPESLFGYLLDLQKKADPKTPVQQADYLFELLSKQDDYGNTLMHRTWQQPAESGTRNGPAYESVEDKLGPVLAAFDRVLGERAAITLTTKLLLQENNWGELPLERFPAKAPAKADQRGDNIPGRDDFIEAFLVNLRAELGSQEKFKKYVAEIIASVLPMDYELRVAPYERVKINAVTGRPTHPLGARVIGL